MNKESLVVSIEFWEKVALLGGVFVAIGVVIESAIGISIFRMEKRLRAVQNVEDGERMLEIEQLRSNNLALKEKVLTLEAKNRWRTVSQEQRDAFMNLTKDVLKVPIRVRISSNANAEAESFSKKIREVLDMAGFIETNKDLALARWPTEMDILWNGAGPELPPILFLNNIIPTRKPADLQNAWKKIRSYPGYSTNSVVKTEIIMENRAGDPEAYVTEENGSPVLHVKFPEPGAFQMTAFMGVQSGFNGMGIQSGWITATNIPNGVCEIFVNPK